MIKVTALIDSDIYAFKAAVTHQEEFGFGDFETDIEGAKQALDENLEEARDVTQADRLIVCLTAPNNWRNDVLPTYKANRKDLVKPVLLESLKAYLAETYECAIRPRLEADDVMGILSTHRYLIKGKKIIVSEDKDMKTIPGWLWNPGKDRHPHFVANYDAHKFHMWQTIAGDSTDHYTGLFGSGAKAADRCLDHLEMDDMWRAVVELYENTLWMDGEGEEHYHTEEHALIQARVARICHACNYNYKTKEVILWNP